MKAVLISIRPQWCELIANGKKTVEVRKTRPKIETPFKCYIYQTMTGYVSKSKENDILVPTTYGKVIGEFVCDNLFNWVKMGYMNSGVKPTYHFGANIAMTCLTYDELEKYAKGRPVFGWHISKLTIYDKPKELSQFVTKGACDCMNCAKCAWLDKGDSMAENEDDCDLVYMAMSRGTELKPIFRPPQSWCYVEELS